MTDIESEKEKKQEREIERVCVCERERESVCVCEREREKGHTNEHLSRHSRMFVCLKCK